MHIHDLRSKLASWVLAACLVLPAAGTAQSLPEGVSEADVQAFRDAVISAGCEIRNDDQAAIVEVATGFDEETLRALAEYLIAAGEMSFTPGLAGLGMDSDTCGGAGEDDDN